LAVIRALSTDLKIEPLLALEILVAAGFVANPVIFVISCNEVFDDGSALPQLEIGVIRVNERGETPVGVETEVFGVSDVFESEVVRFVRQREFGEEYGDFGWIRSPNTTPVIERFERRCHFMWNILNCPE